MKEAFIIMSVLITIGTALAASSLASLDYSSNGTDTVYFLVPIIVQMGTVALVLAWALYFYHGTKNPEWAARLGMCPNVKSGMQLTAMRMLPPLWVIVAEKLLENSEHELVYVRICNTVVKWPLAAAAAAAAENTDASTPKTGILDLDVDVPTMVTAEVLTQVEAEPLADCGAQNFGSDFFLAWESMPLKQMQADNGDVADLADLTA